MKKISIHQPNFLPWMGYFYKIFCSDTHVFLDDVQYTKNSYINRVQIKGNAGVSWLTLPVNVNFGMRINQVNLANSHMIKKILKTLEQEYKKSDYFSIYRDQILNLMVQENADLSVLNVSLIKEICKILNIDREFVLSSDLESQHSSDLRLIDIIKQLKGTIYLSGEGGKKYQNESNFEMENLKVVYVNFTSPVYKQQWLSDFAPGLSILDPLFNCGPDFIIDHFENQVGRV